MAFFNEFPHSRTYDSDLGWLIASMKKLIVDYDELTDSVADLAIKFADPIQWNIATNYENHVVVMDAAGNGYMSVQPVPAGVQLTDRTYWQPIFSFEQIVDTLENEMQDLRSNIAFDNSDSATLGQAVQKDDLLWWNGSLYKALYDIAAGTALIDGTNVTPLTVDEKINYITRQILKPSIAFDNGSAGTAAQNISADDLFWMNDILYQALADITAGTQLIEGTNIRRITVDEKINYIEERYAQTIRDLESSFTELEEAVPDRFEALENGYLYNKKLLLLGDSSIEEMRTYNHFAEYCNCEIENLGTGSATWNDIATVQMFNINSTPDLILILAGSNDINAADPAFLGGRLGSPDVHNHNYDVNNTQTFNRIKQVFSQLRSRFPYAEIILMTRANHPQIPADKWFYFKYFECMIANEFGVPVINWNELINFTYWNSEQGAWILLQDNLHYTDAAINRVTQKICYILKNAWTYNLTLDKPTSFFSPVEYQGYNRTIFMQALAWAGRYCYNQSGGGLGHYSGGMTVRGYNAISQTEFWLRGDVFATDSNARIILPADAGHCYYGQVTYQADGTITVDRYTEFLMVNNMTGESGNISDLDTGVYLIRGGDYGSFTNMPPQAGANAIIVFRFYIDDTNGFGNYLAMHLGNDSNVYKGNDNGKGTAITWNAL